MTYETPTDFPLARRRGQPWSQAEDYELTCRFGGGDSITVLAAYFGRTPGSIISRLKIPFDAGRYKADREYQDGMSHHDFEVLELKFRMWWDARARWGSFDYWRRSVIDGADEIPDDDTRVFSNETLIGWTKDQIYDLEES